MTAEVRTAESRLVDEWVRPALGPDVKVRIGRMEERETGESKAVVLTLLDIVPAPAARRGPGPAPLQLRARYLVTAPGFTPSDEAQCLVDLAFGAFPLLRIELDPFPPGPDTWTALGTHARPALIAGVLLERERELRAVPRVREPLVTRWSRTTTLAGVVMGPRDVPISGALVELDGSALTTYTNHRGEFSFKTVPAGEPAPSLLVSAKGTQLRVSVGGHGGPDDPLLIRFPIPES